MRKRLVSTLLVLYMVLVLLPGTAWATENSGSCGVDGDNISDNVTWQLDSTTGLLTISGNGDMRGFAIGTPPWSGRTKTVVIENGVTGIGSYSFYNEWGGFNNLTSTSFHYQLSNIMPLKPLHKLL